MDIVFVTTAKSDEEGRELLAQLECHSRNKEDSQNMAKHQ